MLYVVAVFALLFGAAQADAHATPAPVVQNDRHASVEVGSAHDHGTEAGVAANRGIRRFAPFDLVLGTLVVLALWLSWPCATRKVRARPAIARFSIRRRGPPAFLAAA
jgi:hypothetical protein